METICRVFSKLRHPASPDISVGLKGEKIMAEKVHMCETCGKTTDKFGHLCDPVEVDEAYVCNHCGQASTDPRHICKPKLQNINFVCIACGRVAELPSQLFFIQSMGLRESCPLVGRQDKG
jgi:DNA-directed RNA polymerase subunit RPC12/RpoP